MPPVILFCLNRDLSRILQKYLSQDKWNEDRCVAEILALLERKQYRNSLLFRDYSQFGKPVIQEDDSHFDFDDNTTDSNSAYWEESLFYAGMLLSRRILLANNLKDKPTNMHNLLVLLCRKSLDERWHNATISRRLDEMEVSEVFFRRIGDQLKKQQTRLGENYSSNSKSRLAEFGPYWLIVQGSAAQVAEELALSDVLRAAPCPLAKAFYHETEQRFDTEWQIAFARVLETLNDRYGLLRTLGLRPDIWLDREKQPNPDEKDSPEKTKKLLLSTDNLEDLIKLKKRAVALLRDGHANEMAAVYREAFAYRKSFNELLDGAKKFAGFESYAEFENSEVGQHLLGIVFQDIDSEYYKPKVDLEENEPFDLFVMQNKMQELIANSPDVFNPIMAYSFQELLVKQRPVFGLDGLLEDSHFRVLLAEDNKYEDKPDHELADLLQIQMAKIIKHQLCIEEKL